MVNTSNKLSQVISIIHNISNDLLINDSPKTLYYPINYHLANQGKRTRSILCLLSFNLFSDKFIDCKELILAIDLLHEFTLIHDDIMDSATVRRGQATINTKWSDNQAILSGDVVLIKAYQHLLRLPKFNKYLLKHFNEIAIKICEGQQIDMDMQQKTTIALNDYLHMINLKTGALIQFSLVSPAIMLGVHNNVIIKLRHIGMYIGQLFQIQDDYLDIYGQYSSTGKAIGIDIRERKKTFLYFKAINLMSKKNKDRFIVLYHSTDPDKIEKVLLYYNKLGIQKLVLEEINKIYNKINLLIHEIPNCPLANRNLLIEFLTHILQREK